MLDGAAVDLVELERAGHPLDRALEPRLAACAPSLRLQQLGALERQAGEVAQHLDRAQLGAPVRPSRRQGRDHEHAERAAVGGLDGARDDRRTAVGLPHARAAPLAERLHRGRPDLGGRLPRVHARQHQRPVGRERVLHEARPARRGPHFDALAELGRGEPVGQGLHAAALGVDRQERHAVGSQQRAQVLDHVRERGVEPPAARGQSRGPHRVRRGVCRWGGQSAVPFRTTLGAIRRGRQVLRRLRWPARPAGAGAT